MACSSYVPAGATSDSGVTSSFIGDVPSGRPWGFHEAIEDMRKDRHRGNRELTDPRVALRHVPKVRRQVEQRPKFMGLQVNLCQGRIGADQFSYPLSSIGKVNVSVAANDVVDVKILHSGPRPAAEPPNHPQGDDDIDRQA